jgi:hypothetical protein
MRYKTITVDVNVDADVYIGDIIDSLDDEDLIDELNRRGYIVNKDTHPGGFDREDLQFLLEIIDQIPETIYTRRVRDKLMRARFG